MALEYGFYNSVMGDRRYNSVQMSEIFEGLITDGVYPSVGDKFAVRPSEGMQVIVGTGRAWFDGTWSKNRTPYPIDIDQADPIFDRIDTICIKVDKNPSARENTFYVVKGSLSADPMVPSLPVNDGVSYHPIAYVRVKALTSAISIGDVTILVGRGECPYTTSILQQTNIDELFAQWNDQFLTWWNGLKAILDGDTVGNILNLLNDKVNISDKASIEDIRAGVDDFKWVTPYSAKIGSRDIGEVVESWTNLFYDIPNQYLAYDGMAYGQDYIQELYNSDGSSICTKSSYGMWSGNPNNTAMSNNVNVAIVDGYDDPNYILVATSAHGIWKVRKDGVGKKELILNTTAYKSRYIIKAVYYDGDVYVLTTDGIVFRNDIMIANHAAANSEIELININFNYIGMVLTNDTIMFYTTANMTTTYPTFIAWTFKNVPKNMLPVTEYSGTTNFSVFFDIVYKYETNLPALPATVQHIFTPYLNSNRAGNYPISRDGIYYYGFAAIVPVTTTVTDFNGTSATDNYMVYISVYEIGGRNRTLQLGRTNHSVYVENPSTNSNITMFINDIDIRVGKAKVYVGFRRLTHAWNYRGGVTIPSVVMKTSMLLTRGSSGGNITPTNYCITFSANNYTPTSGVNTGGVWLYAYRTTPVLEKGTEVIASCGNLFPAFYKTVNGATSGNYRAIIDLEDGRVKELVYQQDDEERWKDMFSSTRKWTDIYSRFTDGVYVASRIQEWSELVVQAVNGTLGNRKLQLFIGIRYMRTKISDGSTNGACYSIFSYDEDTDEFEMLGSLYDSISSDQYATSAFGRGFLEYKIDGRYTLISTDGVWFKFAYIQPDKEYESMPSNIRPYLVMPVESNKYIVYK